MSSADRFGIEWGIFQSIIPEYETQFLRWISPLKKSDFKNKRVLDAGCGIGRNSWWPLIYGAKAVTAFDFDRGTVRIAEKNLSKFKNVSVSFKSVYTITYSNEFDIVLCIGVLHHLKDPQRAIHNLIRAVKKGGVFVAWVYGREGNERMLHILLPLRAITSRLPTRFLYYASIIPALIFYSVLKFLKPQHPYYTLLSQFRFWHVHSIIFDQMLPDVAKYWTRNEVKILFADDRIKKCTIHQTNNNSWTVIAQKR